MEKGTHINKWIPLLFGGDYWNRTNDPLHVKQVL